MKKKITILFIALLASVGIYGAPHTTSCDDDCGLHEWNEYTGSGDWSTALEHLVKSGQITSIEPTYTTTTNTGSFNLSLSGQFYRCQTYNNAYRYWYIAQFNIFDITYTVQQYINNKWVDIYSKTETIKCNGSVDDSKKGNAGHYYEYVTPKYENFSKSIDCCLQIDNTTTNYKVKYIVSIIPSNVGASTNKESVASTHYLSQNYYSETCNFLKEYDGGQYTGARKKHTSSKEFTITYTKESHTINKSDLNPQTIINGTTYNMIYNNGNAKIGMSLNSNNVAQEKSIGCKDYNAYSAFIKNKNNGTYSAFSSEPIKSLVNITPSNNILYTKERTLSEFGSFIDGDKINIQHTLIYSKNTPSNSEATYSNNYHIRSTTTLKYIVVPTVKFPAFTTEEKKIIYKCYSSDNKNDINYVVGFNDKKIITTTNNIVDITAYSPEYKWLYSTDGSSWKEIEDIYINNANVGLSNNLQIRSRILQGKNQVYFKQKAILKAFSSNSKSSLYTEYIDGKYYIAVESEKYTLAKMPTPTNNNFGTDSGDNYISGDSYEKVLLDSKPYNGKRVSFRFVVYNLASDVYTALNRIANKTITITKNDGSKEIINGNTYLIQDYQKGEWKFDCKIEFCNGTSIGKSFTINSYPGIFFSTNSNEKNIYKLYSKDIKNDDERYIISLISDNITTTNQYLTEEDLKTEYSWEFSYDKKTWQKIDKKYIIKPTVIIGKGDTHISSTLLGDKSEVYVRQKAILKGFSQNTENSTFNELIDGKYYIGETSDIYTIKKLPNITNDNITFTSGAGYASKDMITCYDNVDSYNGLNIEFNVTADANITEEELEAIRNNATYSIKRTKTTFDGNSVVEDVTKTLTPNKHIVTGFTPGVEEMKYTCTVTYNGVDFVKTLTLKSYPEEKIDINKVEAITKGSSITFVDGASNQILAMCPKGEDFQVRYFLDKDDDRKNLAAYEAKVVYDCPNYSTVNPWVDFPAKVEYPEMVPYPEYDAPDFDSMNLITLHQYIDDKGWSFEDDNMGQSLDDAPASQIRGYLKVKDKLVYDADKLTYEQQYIADKLAYDEKYEADSIAYTDAYHKAESEYYAQCDSIRDWFDFKNPDNYSTPLENITDNEEEAEFLIRTKSEKGGCYSNEVKIKVTYFDGITGNVIAFTDEAIKNKQEVYVTAGEGNPYIKGELIDGAYGIPKNNEECTYTYVWKYLETQSNTWEILKDKDGNEFKFVEMYDGTGERPSVNQQFISLKAGTISNISELFPNGVDISRFVYSQRGTNSNAKLEHQSNILKIFSAKPINEGKFTYSIDENFCPGEGNVNIDFSDIELNENEVLDVKVKNADLAISINYKDKKANIANPVSDLEVAISRIDTISNVKSNEIILDIDVPEFKAGFSVYVDYIEHSLSEDVINIQAGSRVVLHNNTVSDLGATVYNWTLQVQKDDYRAQRSEKEEPVCYLYNPGINKIILEATSENKCKSTIVADNINVINTQERNVKVNSFFEDDNIQIMAFEEEINVYPTILVDDAIVNIKSNIEQYNVVISDVAGKVMLTAENLTMSNELDLAFLPKGIYIMKAANKSFKIIKK